jgi:uncharacterized protein YggL (DUF469 family)
MNKFFRAIIAAWGAKKLGGGCLSTIIIFIVIYMLLGKCNNNTRAAQQNLLEDQKGFTAIDAFTDAEGNINMELPEAKWDASFRNIK